MPRCSLPLSPFLSLGAFDTTAASEFSNCCAAENEAVICPLRVDGSYSYGSSLTRAQWSVSAGREGGGGGGGGDWGSIVEKGIVFVVSISTP